MNPISPISFYKRKGQLLSDSGNADGIFFIRFGSLHAILQHKTALPILIAGLTKLLVNTGQLVNAAEENNIKECGAGTNFVRSASAATIE